jgi:hypothetical protein
METQQMMEFLLKMEANRKKDQDKLLATMEADREERRVCQEKLREKIATDKEEMKAAMRSMRSELDEAIQQRIEQIKARTEAMQRKIGSSHMEIVSAFKPKIEKVTMACQEMETRQEEKPTSLDRKPEAAQEEVPIEEAKVMPVGEPKKKRRRDRKMAMQHHRQKPETLTRENCRPQKRLPIARTETNHRVEVTWKMQAEKKMPRCATVA